VFLQSILALKINWLKTGLSLSSNFNRLNLNQTMKQIQRQRFFCAVKADGFCFKSLKVSGFG